MYDEPDARAEIDASLQEIYAAMFITASPAPVKAALEMLGHDVGGLRLPLVECDERSAPTSTTRSPSTGCSPRGSPRVERHTSRPPAGRRRRDRQEPHRRRVRRPDRRGRLRAALPDRRDDGHRPRPAGLHVPARERRRDRGDRHHPRPRGPPRRAAVGDPRPRPGQDPGRLRRPADDRDGALEARRAQAARRQPRGAADRRRRAGRPVRDRAHPPHALDPGLQRHRAHDAARHRPVHRRLQVRPDAGRRRARRTCRGWPSSAARALLLLCGDSTNVDRPGISRERVDRRPAPGPRVRPLQGPHRRHLLRVEHPPRPAGRARGRSRTTARSRWSGARCARTSTSAAASATSTSRRGCWCRRARSTSGPTRRSWSSRPAPRASRCRRCAGWPTATTRRWSSSRGTPWCSAPRRSPATSAPSTRRSTACTTSAARSITARDAPIHASGHGYAEEVKMMINLTRPKYVMPVHGDFKRMLIHSELAEAVGVPRENIFRTENGTPLEIDADGARFGDKVTGGDDLRRRRGHRRCRRRRAARPPDAVRGRHLHHRRHRLRAGRLVGRPARGARARRAVPGGQQRVHRRAARGGRGLAGPRRRAADHRDRRAGVASCTTIWRRSSTTGSSGARWSCRSSSRSDRGARARGAGAAPPRPARGSRRRRTRTPCAASRAATSTPPSR